MHGIDLDKTVKPGETMETTKRDTGPIFKDLEEYKDMSPEEREELTQQMMGKLKGWASKTALGS
jgi:hypothetical protein